MAKIGINHERTPTIIIIENSKSNALLIILLAVMSNGMLLSETIGIYP